MYAFQIFVPSRTVEADFLTLIEEQFGLRLELRRSH
jgi:hypothetical protein